MMPALHLALTDSIDATRWRRVLSDDRDLHLDPTSREHLVSLDPNTYPDSHIPIYPPDLQLIELGCASVRILTAFSLPACANLLNLTRESCGLQGAAAMQMIGLRTALSHVMDT